MGYHSIPPRYVAYTEEEHFRTLLTLHCTASSSEDSAKQTSRLQTLNTHLSSRTTILGSKPSVADIAVYTHLAPLITSWSSNERTGEQGYHHIVRHADFVQNSPLFGPLKLEDGEKVKINPDDVVSKIKPVDAKAEKERKKKEKELAQAGAAGAAAAGGTANSAAPNAASGGTIAGTKEKVKDTAAEVGAAVASAVGAGPPAGTDQKKQKKEKKEKAPKQQPQKPVEKPLSPALVDLRVGHILKAVQHDNADSLYVSTIACGDPPGTDNTSEYEGQVCRTVCSGLSGKIPLEEMQGRKIVAVCNLKPVTMRGVKSCAMVLAASEKAAEGEDPHSKTVELVNPPAESTAGERVYVDGWTGEPEPVLNPKKKVFETVQPGFRTTDDLEVLWDVGSTTVPNEGDAHPNIGHLKTKDGLCTVKKLKGASIS